jgi:hypothetical protein
MRIFLISLTLTLMASSLQAGPEQAIVNINVDELYVYDAQGEELGTIDSKTVEKKFTSLTINGKRVTGLPVIEVDNAEGLVSVNLPSYSGPVWVETMAVEIWPGKSLECPQMAETKQQIEQSGMTIGFGDHCK